VFFPRKKQAQVQNVAIPGRLSPLVGSISALRCKPAREGQKGDVAGAFDGNCQFTLVPGAGASLTTRANLALFGDEAAQDIGRLVSIIMCRSAQNWHTLGRA